MCVCACVTGREMVKDRGKNRLWWCVLVAHLVDRGGYMYHIKIWVHIWPGAFIICPGSSIMAQVYVPVCEYSLCVSLHFVGKKIV